jgi:hypothetical protein
MNNRDIINWWDSKGIIERVNLREKYGFNILSALDVDDYRFIYNEESKS